jgi:GAF domain-containing protein
VADVETFADHIACSSTTRSELVVPVYAKDQRLIGVFDIDSDQPDAFTQEDADQIGRILKNVFSI